MRGGGKASGLEITKRRKVGEKSLKIRVKGGGWPLVEKGINRSNVKTTHKNNNPIGSATKELKIGLKLKREVRG